MTLVGCADDAEDDGAHHYTQLDQDVADEGDSALDAGLDQGSDPATDSSLPDLGNDRGSDLVEEPPPDAGPWEPSSMIVGHTVQNRPIVVEQYGVSGPVLLLMAAIHGNEHSAVTFGERIRSTLLAGLAELAGIRIAFIGAANPDGIALETRQNANSIDLNRNFPTENFSEGDGSGGQFPLSEPESQVIKAIFDNIEATAVLSMHCCVPVLDYDGPGYGLALAMSQAMSEPARFDVGRLGSLPGSFGSYVGAEGGVPIVTVEFALDADLDILVQLDNVERAVEAAADWVGQNGVDPDIVGLDWLETAGTALDSFILTESAGGLPIRVETVREGLAPPVLLLAGLTDNDPGALHVAEHIRRILLHEVDDVSLVFLTGANPDGIESASTLNATGDDVAADFLSGSFGAEEADAFRSLVETMEPRLVINVMADDTADSAASAGVDRDTVLAALPARVEDLGTATGPLAEFFSGQGIAILLLGVHGQYGRGDDQGTDYFPAQDPVFFSSFVRRIIKPGVLCTTDGFCDTLCQSDPDCACGCDFNDYCEAGARGSMEACACDPDCQGGLTACSADNHCDSWCPENTDPDCTCNCNFNEYCEAAARNSSETCLCDPDCQGGLTACSADGHCDTWCPTDVDPDC